MLIGELGEVRAVRTLASAIRCLLLACLILALEVRPALAECAFLDPWPAFEDVAPAAETVVLGEVVEDRTSNGDGGGRLEHFGLQVEMAFRGDAEVGSVIDVAFVSPGPPPVLCPDTFLRPLLGEVLVIAIDAPGPNGTTLNSAAWVEGAPDEMQQGLGKITRRQLRSLFDLPATDALSGAVDPTRSEDIGWLIVGSAAVLGGRAALRRSGRRENVIPPANSIR